MAAGLAKNHTLFGAALKPFFLFLSPKVWLRVLPSCHLMKVSVRSLAGDESVFDVEGERRLRHALLRSLSQTFTVALSSTVLL